MFMKSKICLHLLHANIVNLKIIRFDELGLDMNLNRISQYHNPMILESNKSM